MCSPSAYDQASVERRKLWPAMVDRVRAVFAEVEHLPLAGHYGSLYLHPVVPEALRKFQGDQILGQLQLSCGTRQLGLWGVETKAEERKGKAKPLFESGAALWFNQAPSGLVTVFMAPYGSDNLKMNEDNIVLGMYKSPAKITDKEIRKLFSKFFKYLSITSAHHQQTFSEYAWRLWLIYRDVRTRKYNGGIKLLERLLIAAGAAACIIPLLPK
ncbi:hypothetical protein KDX30_11280 [Pseudomonas sp. CDFA 553]|uniref:hypothetical protein n=1 Tax=Pseudomonas quasicaspiana TaxID=2829821 RepID=UPI001E3C5EC5|nr:hypothetical protein [Pseudomonas quasicaspiana]MCD5988484.1 hypothetical protein [Pseudomonas quasicaspiana]